MSNRPYIFDMYVNGITDLLSVVPPGATLSAGSTLDPSQLGKAPGRRLDNGTWVGTSWRKLPVPEPADVKQWVLVDNANVGLRAKAFPALDIDCMDAAIVRQVEALAFECLGVAPIRTGRAPKALLMYRTDEPFPKRKISFDGGVIEMLGDGQQYLIFGTHPSGAVYSWDTDMAAFKADKLVKVTQADVDAFFIKVGILLVELGQQNVQHSASRGQVAVVQQGLRAPDLASLVTTVRAIPNTLESHSSRESYIKMGAAIAAAWPDDEEDAFSIFAEWAAKWPGGNDPDMVRRDWRGLRAPFAIGYPWLQDQARENGHLDATGFEFEDEPAAPPEIPVVDNDMDISRALADALRSKARWVAIMNNWVVWDGQRWKVDVNGRFHQRLTQERIELASRCMNSPKKLRDRITAGPSNSWLEAQIKTMPGMLAEAEMLDHDPDLLNTPGGTVHLPTGVIRPSDPDDLITQLTLVGADTGEPTRWMEFLWEATGGDAEYVEYLQRLAGYVVTGRSEEEKFFLLYGPGGNGKGVFMSTLSAVLGDYAKAAPSSMLADIQRSGEAPSATLASLHTTRFAYEAELPMSFRLADDSIKRLTGRDTVTARVPYAKAPITFVPKFKLVLASNAKPSLPVVDPGLVRRLHMLPFVVTPRVVDMKLKDSLLRDEGPRILGWMIEGARKWYTEGLGSCSAVLSETAEYFSEQDLIAQWVAEATVPTGTTPLGDLFSSWRAWSAARGNRRVGDSRQLTSGLARLNLSHVTVDGAAAYEGISVKAQSFTLEG